MVENGSKKKINITDFCPGCSIFINRTHPKKIQEALEACPECDAKKSLEAVADLAKYRKLLHNRKSGSAKTVICNQCRGVFSPAERIADILNKGWENIKNSRRKEDRAAIKHISDAIRTATVLANLGDVRNPFKDATVQQALRYVK